jgi:pimeloyl-ACP methyl ester carboxylesterase
MQLGLSLASIACLMPFTGAVLGTSGLAFGSAADPCQTQQVVTQPSATPTARPAPRGAPGFGEVPFERVLIKTKDSLTLVGSFYAPPRSKQSAPGALLIHDAGGSRAELVGLAERLQRQGFGALVLDLRGHGESATSDCSWTKLGEKERASLWAFAVRDVHAAADWLLGQSAIHSANLSLVGYRAGTTLAARHAKSDENVRSLTLLSPPPQGATLGFDLVKDLDDLAGLPIYMAFSKEEESTSKMLEGPDKRKGDLEFLQIAIFKCPGTELLEDKKLTADVSKWIQERASPSKGSASR